MQILFNALLKKILTIWFDHYKCTKDGGNGFSRIVVLKKKYKYKWEENTPYLSSNNNMKHSSSLNINNNKVLILCALEPVDNQIQIEVYNKVIDIFSKYKYELNTGTFP